MYALALPAITPAELAAAISYPAYLAIHERLVAEGRTSGPEQSDFLAGYTKLNLTRAHRVEKHTTLSEELLAALAMIEKPQLWVVLSEVWCGDAAQNLPLLHLAAEASPKVTLGILYRDEHLPLMNQHLTHGGRAIPKLLVLDGTSHQLLASWGPRPAPAQALIDAHKLDPAGETKEALYERLHGWYAHDRTATLQAELSAVLGTTIERK
jgi:hypothetical protein